MLEITVPKQEMFDDSRQEFTELPEVTLKLEHSLVSVSKWESKWQIPFLSDDPRTDAQTLDYIRMMDLSDDTDPEIFDRLSRDNYTQIGEYINSKMTATWFSDAKRKQRAKPKEVITSEIIYYWMIAQSIPFECQYWHLERLLTLIKVCNEKNTPEKDRRKMSKSEIAARNRELNARRKAEMKTNG